MIFVTGATGKVGRPLVSALLARGEGVRALARRPAEAGLPAGVEVVGGDLNDPGTLNHALKDCSVLYHLAAHVEEGALDDQALRERLHRTNVEGSSNMARAALEHGVRRMIHVSSYAVYGYRSGGALTAATPVSLDTPYGRSKWEAEEALRGLLRGSAVELIILRPVVITGIPGDRHDLVSDLVKLARKGLLPRPLGDTPARKALVHLDDVVAALIAAKDHGRPGETYVISAPRSFPFAEIVSTLHQLLGRRVSVPAPALLLRMGACLNDCLLAPLGLPTPLNGRRVEKLLRDQQFDVTATLTDLGYTPRRTDLAEMLRPYVT